MSDETDSVKPTYQPLVRNRRQRHKVTQAPPPPIILSGRGGLSIDLVDTIANTPAVRKPKISKFDELAGGLMVAARPRRQPNGRLPSAAYAEIAAQLDSQDFKLLDCLEREAREALADWNNRESRRTGAVRTFTAALKFKDRLQLRLRRALLKRLSRAEANWSKAHPELSAR